MALTTKTKDSMAADGHIRSPFCSEYWSVRCLATSSRPLYVDAIREDSHVPGPRGKHRMMMNHWTSCTEPPRSTECRSSLARPAAESRLGGCMFCFCFLFISLFIFNASIPVRSVISKSIGPIFAKIFK